MHEKQLSIICFHLNPSVTQAINSKSPGFVSEVTPTIPTAYSSFTRASFPQTIYCALPEKGLHELVKIQIFKNTTMIIFNFMLFV